MKFHGNNEAASLRHEPQSPEFDQFYAWKNNGLDFVFK